MKALEVLFIKNSSIAGNYKYLIRCDSVCQIHKIFLNFSVHIARNTKIRDIEIKISYYSEDGSEVGKKVLIYQNQLSEN